MSEAKVYTIDAEGKVLGRLATQVADFLRGKKEATFLKHQDKGAKVVVFNCDLLKFTGNKIEQNEFVWHTGYPGGIKKKKLSKQMEQDSTQVLRRAVLGMLPKNKLQNVFINKLEMHRGEIKK